MERDDLRRLIAGGETWTVEFKRGSINDSELVDAVACLSNGSGGHLLLGVEDDGDVTGAAERHGSTTDPVRLQAVIANRTDPSVVTKIEVADLNGKEVIVIEVPAATSVVGTSDGRFTRRSIDVHGKPGCVPMRPHEVTARAGAVGAQDYSRVPLSDASFDDLSPIEFARLRTMAGDDGDAALRTLSDEDILKALDLWVAPGEITAGALLLFGTEEALARHVPTHEVAFQELAGLEVRANTITRVPLLRAMEDLAAAIGARNPEEEIEIGLFRVPLPRFAAVAVRELVANALVHREYRLPGSTLVEIDQSAMTVSNPGGLPEGVTLGNLLTTPPRPRNPAIADAFKRAGLVDRTSRGINRVFLSQLQIGRPAPDYGRSTQSSVVARLRSGPADRELAAFIAESRQRGQQFSLEDLLALHEVRSERRISTARAAELFQVSQQEARSTLNGLVERGLLEARGEGKGRTYHLAAAVYRRLGEPMHYVRTRGFDNLQQEQMVLAYVASHGRITRREAAELCQLESEQASRLLKRLRAEGKLWMEGERRAAYYVAPSNGV
ncbi:MAG: putative DNA binding domain-containing protein [Acidimicrobiia bacterium]|nr:putative DNA binding domain-containing protein [Acidimicrobiia bacterium]